MKQQNLVTGSVLVVIIIAAIVCVGMVNGTSLISHYIAIDPLSGMNAGNPISLTGTTSLPAGSPILVEVYSASLETDPETITDPETGTVSGEFSGIIGVTSARKGDDDHNIWGFSLETNNLEPGEYIVSVSSLSGDISRRDYTKGDISGTLRFSLYPKSLTEHNGASFIRIDPVSDKKTGEKFTITGSTNLASGTRILVQIFPSAYETDTKRTGDGEFSGAVSVIPVTDDTSDHNNWSIDLDATSLKSGVYIARASVFTGDVGKGDFSSGEPTATIQFTVE